MENKKGILVPETLKLILAVLSILLLFYLGLKLYGIFTVNTEMEQAKATIDEIDNKMSLLSVKGDFVDVLILNPKNWALIVYDNNLCLCPEDSFEDKDKCLKNGYCKIFEKKIVIDSDCLYGKFPINSIQNCYPFLADKLPLELILQKTDDTILIRSMAGKASENILSKISADSTIKPLIVNYYNNPKSKEAELRNKINEIEEIKKNVYDWELEIKLKDGESKSLKSVDEIIYFSDSFLPNIAETKILESSKEYEITLKLGKFARIGDIEL